MNRQIPKKMEISAGAGITPLVSKEINAVATQMYIGSHGHFIIIKFLFFKQLIAPLLRVSIPLSSHSFVGFSFPFNSFSPLYIYSAIQSSFILSICL